MFGDLSTAAAKAYIDFINSLLKHSPNWDSLCLGNGTGNLGLSQRNPYLYPWKPIPMVMGMGRVRVYLWVLWVQRPVGVLQLRLAARGKWSNYSILIVHQYVISSVFTVVAKLVHTTLHPSH